MSTYRQRKDQADRQRGDQPCARCGHEIGAHRGYPITECIAPECDCTNAPQPEPPLASEAMAPRDSHGQIPGLMF